METILSILAILISVGSLGVSGWVAWRDQSKLKTECRVFQHGETAEYSYIRVKAVNTGRRPITLLFIMGVYTEGRKSGYKLGNFGKRLEEGDYWEESIGKFDGMMICDIGEGDIVELTDLYLEDTAGNQYPVANAGHCIGKLWGSKHPFGVRTHIS